jgi:hypothetical protein
MKDKASRRGACQGGVGKLSTSCKIGISGHIERRLGALSAPVFGLEIRDGHSQDWEVEHNRVRICFCGLA